MRSLAPTLAILVLGCSNEGRLRSPGGNDDTDPPDIDNPRPDDEEPPVAVCGARPKTALVGETIDFIGENSYDVDPFPILAWSWRLVRKPEGSEARLPRGEANLVGFEPDVIGSYDVTLVVTDEAGKQSTACATTATLENQDGLYVEILPSSPGDGVQAVIRPVDEDPCGVGACDVDWGQPGKSHDDPVVNEIHDGLATISVPEPAANAYDIALVDGGALWLADNPVTVVIWLGRREAWRGVVTVKDEGKVVPVARVVLPAGTVQLP